MKEFRNMILAMAGQGISALGTDLYNFAISFYILSVTGSSTSFAMSLIVAILPRIILSPFVGSYIDRANKKMVVIVADFSCGIIMIALFVLTANQSLTLWMIYMASALLNVSFIFLNNSYIASMYNIVGKKYITKVNSFNQTIRAIVQIISPIAGGIVYAWVDIRMFMLLNAVSFFASSFSELFIDFSLHSTLKTASAKTERFFASMKAGFEYAISQKALFTLGIYALFLNFFLSAFTVIMPYTLITIHEFDSDMVGLIQSAFPVGTIIASVVVGAVNLKFSRRNFSTGIFAMGLVLALFSMPAFQFWSFEGVIPYYYSFLFIFLSGTAVALNVPLGVHMQMTVEEAFRGRFFSLLGTMSGGIMPVSYLLVGFLITILPTYVILLVSALALFGISVHIKGNRMLDMGESGEKVMEVV